MTDNTSTTNQVASDATEGNTQDTTATTNSGKTFTQDEVNRIVTQRLAQFERKFADIDVSEYRALKEAQAQKEQEQAIKRQEFDKVLNQTKEHYNGQVQKLRSELEAIKVDGAIVNAAANFKAVQPQHVARLLKGQVRLGEDGHVEVLDDKGGVRYNPETASPLTVEELVGEFIRQNPFYQSPGPSGSGSKSNLVSDAPKKMNLGELDMKNPEHRKAYAEYRKASGIA